MLDFTKKRTMPLILGDGTRLDLTTPRAEDYFKLRQMGADTEDFINACLIILNLNRQKITFTKEEIMADLAIDEMFILVYTYLDFVADLQNDPNFASRPIPTKEVTGISTTTP